MIKARLSTLLDNINIAGRSGEGDPVITSLVYDSRDAVEGSLFFALPGIHTDGHDYIDDALRRGASAVCHSRELSGHLSNAVYIRVDDTRRVMSPISARFFGDPSRELTVIGVTGTDGKSTTVSFIDQLLTAAGHKTGFLSTVMFNVGGKVRKNVLRQSTPEAPEVHGILREMRDAGCTHAVVEATSHGLSPRNNRLGDVAFDVGVFTNLSAEHLEFHKTFEQYRDDKANLFRLLDPKGGTAILNTDDPSAGYMREASRAPVLSYSLSDPAADFYAERIEEKGERQHITLRYGAKKIELSLPLTGVFNVENLFAALAAVSAASSSTPEELKSAVDELVPVKGRMVPVDLGQPFRVLVDYAHTPGSFEKLFPDLRRTTEGRLIALFSSAGERDLEKRPKLGEIASRYADVIVLADEDPRGEDPREVLRDVAEGCQGKTEGVDLFLIEDRRAAIRHSFSIAGEGDLVVLLGKGHEASIFYADGPIEWDEEEEAKTALREMGYDLREMGYGRDEKIK